MMTFLIQATLLIGFLAHTHAIGIGKDKKVYYTGQFSEDVVSCPDFENNFMICDLRVSTSDEDQSLLVLKGTIKLNGNITTEVMVTVTVCKSTIAGCQVMYTAVGNVCTTLTDRTTPWYPLLAAFKRDKCDISKGSYNVDKMTVEMYGAKDVVTHESVGDYELKVLFELGEKVLACYDITVSIEEKHE